MALGIYKQGQGYWVRMMTAIAAGVLTLACAAWVWQSLARIDPPSAGRDVRVEQPVGAVPPVGSSIELLANGESSPMATGQLQRVTEESGGVLLRIKEPVLTPEAVAAGRAVGDARAARGPGGFSGSVPANGMASVDAFEMVYVRMAAASIIILAGAFVIFLYVGQKPKPVDFLIATDGEARKVNWSTRKEVMGSTWVVIGAMFLIAGTLFVIDVVFQAIFSAINVLER